MKKTNQTAKLFFGKTAIAELNYGDLQRIVGGTNTAILQQVIPLITVQTITATFICDEVNPN